MSQQQYNQNDLSIRDTLQLFNKPDLLIQKNAENRLKEYEKNNFGEYVTALLNEFINVESDVRQFAGILLKNAVGGGTNKEEVERFRKRWQNQDETKIRRRIKSGVMQLLQSDIREIRTTAALIVAKIASIEGLQQWNELISTLLALMKKNFCLTNGVLVCISFIAEDETLRQDLQSYTNLLLNAVAYGFTSKNPTVLAAATQCLYSILCIISNTFDDYQERDRIMDIICNACRSNSGDMRLYAFMSLVRVCELYYDHLQPYIQTIFQITKECIDKAKNDQEEDNIGKQAIEFWSSCAEIEKEIMLLNEKGQSKNLESKRQNYEFINKACEKLIPSYLQCLLLQPQEYDDEDWTLMKAAGCSLQLFASVAKDNVLEIVKDFVEENINNKNWRNREASLCAFALSLEGPSPMLLEQLVPCITPLVIALMRDENKYIRATATYTLGEICKIVPHIIDNNGYNINFIKNKLITTLIVALAEDNLIAERACWCLSLLLEYYGKNKSIQSPFTLEITCRIMEELLKQCLRSNNDSRIILANFELLNGFIHFASEEQKTMMQHLFIILVQKLTEICVKNRCGSLQATTINGLFNAITMCIQKWGKQFLTPETILNDNNNIDLAGNIISALCKISESNQELAIYEEALNCIGVIARHMQEDFWKYLLTSQVQSLLIRMLLEIDNNGNNVELSETIAGIIGDIFRACEPWFSKQSQTMQEFCDKIVNLLLTQVVSDKLDIEAKSHIISTLADIGIGLGMHSGRYLSHILSNCLDLECQLIQKTDDECFIEQINLIRTSIIDVCRAALTSFSEIEKLDPFMQYIPKIIQLFQNIVILGKCNNVELLSSCYRFLMMLKDLKDTRIREAFRNDTTKLLLQLSKDADPTIHKEAQQAFLCLK